MGKYEKDWARRKRVELTAELGGVCVNCGINENLEFDCKVAMGHKHHKYDTSHRMSFYRQQHRAGNLQLLCKSCNSAKAAREEVQIPNGV